MSIVEACFNVLYHPYITEYYEATQKDEKALCVLVGNNLQGILLGEKYLPSFVFLKRME